MSHKPSPQQLEALRHLPPGRSLLVQYHWRWTDEGANAGIIMDCYKGLVEAGVGLLSQAKFDLTAIGDDARTWSEFWLLEFPDAEALEAHILSPSLQALMDSAQEVEVLIASSPHPKMRRAIRLLNRFMPWLPSPRRGSQLPLAEIEGGINPTAQQMQAFEAADQNNPVHMFNLLQFHDRAQYSDGDRNCSGRQAYEEGYGKVAMSCFLRLGGRIVALGKYRFTLVGAGGDPATDAWDEIAVIQYPRRPTFLHMLTNPGYVAALEHRHAGLARTVLWSTTPEAAFR